MWGARSAPSKRCSARATRPWRRSAFSAKFFEDGRSLTKRYHVALQPPWRLLDLRPRGGRRTSEKRRRIPESAAARRSLARCHRGRRHGKAAERRLRRVGRGWRVQALRPELWRQRTPAAAAPRFVTADRAQARPLPRRCWSRVEWKFGDAKTQLRQYAVEASADDVAVARQTQDERFAGDEPVAALDGTFGVKQSEDIAVTAPFQYVGDATPLVAAPLSKSGLKLKPQDGAIDSNAETDAKLAVLLERRGAGRRSLARPVARRKTRAFQRPVWRGLRHAVQAPDGLRFRGPVLGAAAPRAPKRAHQAGGRAARRLSGTTPCDEAEELFMDRASATQGSTSSNTTMAWRFTTRRPHRSGAARTTAQTTRRTPRTRGCARNRARTTSRA